MIKFKKYTNIILTLVLLIGSIFYIHPETYPLGGVLLITSFIFFLNTLYSFEKIKRTTLVRWLLYTVSFELLFNIFILIYINYYSIDFNLPNYNLFLVIFIFLNVYVIQNNHNTISIISEKKNKLFEKLIENDVNWFYLETPDDIYNKEKYLSYTDFIKSDSKRKGKLTFISCEYTNEKHLPLYITTNNVGKEFKTNLCVYLDELTDLVYENSINMESFSKYFDTIEIDQPKPLKK